MTEEEQLLLNDLKANTRQFFTEYGILETEKKGLENELFELKQEIEILKQEKSELSHKNEKLKIASSILSGVDENKEAKQRINKLVREIDKCIALLNK